ncbi:MAG TPA: M48 family metalloprotease [Angustibacter sp.]|nr:M48 family metalloprotease [Angustibacter sp.]
MTARWRRLAPWVVLGVLTAALVVMAALVVPWSTVPGVAPAPARDFTAAQLARDTAFHHDLRRWTYPRAALALLVTLALGLTPVGARLVAWCGRRLGGSWPATVVGGTVGLSVVTTAVALPLSAAAEVVLRRYGLSTQGWSGWSLDVLRATAVSAVVTALALVLLVGFARRWPSGWWLPGAAVAAALVVVGSALYPLVIEPLSNDFRSMPPSAQRSALLQLAARDGQPVSDVLVADASRRTTAENAYVSGLGATRRLVVYDTLLRGADEREVELVVAHELGHVADHDVARGTALGALGAAWAVVALALLSRRRWWWRRAGAAGPGDPRAVALLLALLAGGSYLAAPATNLVSRRIEASADVHALQLTRDPVTFAAMQRQLAVANLSDLQPRWYRQLLYATHPSPPWRVALARAWAREHGVPGPAPLR